jgi:hypothetical protein
MSFFGGKIIARRFSTFATISATSGLMQRNICREREDLERTFLNAKLGAELPIGRRRRRERRRTKSQ